MRFRAPAVLLASLAACAIPATAAFAVESPMPYAAEVTADQVSVLGKKGFDVGELGFDPSGAATQQVQFIATEDQAKDLARDGITAERLAVDAPVAKSKALGDSPNAFFNVYRMYSEPGGIADGMRALAAANPDIMKLEQIGTSTLGKPILAIKMTENARNVPDGSRDAILFSAVNHAREWIAAEMGRRLPIWFAENKNDPKIRELIQTRELWFLPIQNPDGYDYTFTCGIGWGKDAKPCDYRTLGNNPSSLVTNRYWRKTLRDNTGNGVYGDPSVQGGPGDGVDPNRNYPAKRGIDEEGASDSIGNETYRGPYALSEPENLAVDRLQRRVKFRANINYHSAGQLLLTPVSYTTDYYPPDSTLFDAITGTDGDEAVFPYRSQHSSDLYESNGDTIDNAYMNYGIIGWTPEMDTCGTLGEPSGCNQFASPDDEEKVEAVFSKNLQFALNVTNSLPNLARPKNFDNDPSHYQIKPTQDIQLNRFDVSYGGPQVVEATIRKELGPSDITVTVTNPGANTTIRMAPAPAGERYNEVKGYYFERRRATIPAQIGNHPIKAGDIVNVVVKAGGLQQEFNYRVEATPDVPAAGQPAKKRVLVVAAEDYTGKSPNVTAGYDVAPRYLAQHVAALEAAGYEVETFNVDAPPANGGSPNGVVRPQIKYPTYLGVLSHFDAVNYYSGDDFAPQEVTETNPRRMTSATAQTGSQEMAPWAHKLMLELRDYANEGGKLIVDGRNIHQAMTGGATLGATGPYTWTPEKLFGFNYPPNNGGDDDLPGTAWQRSRTSSNDTWQNYLGVLGRQGGIGTALNPQQPNTNPVLDDLPFTPKTGGLFDGMGTITLDESNANDPNQTAAGAPLPQKRVPVRLRNWSSSTPNEPLRQETVQADFTAPAATAVGGGTILSTRDAVTFSFGLEQVDQATRNELVKRSLSYLLPATADTTPPTVAGFKYPANNAVATPNDPVELEVTAFDERGDMKQVQLFADGQPYATVPVYPFQFRYSPPASAVGKTVVLTAVATDKAGNSTTSGTLNVNVVAGSARIESPVPSGDPVLSGTPVVGQTLDCLSGGFLNAPESYSYEWLRNDEVVEGADGASYTLTAADLGRGIACHLSATNSAGTGDAFSDELTISAAPAAPIAAPAPPAAQPQPQPAAPKGISLKSACKLSSSRKAVVCTISASSKTTRLTSTVRVSRTKLAATKSATGSVKVTVRSTKKLKKGQKMTLKVRYGNTIKILTVKAS